MKRRPVWSVSLVASPAIVLLFIVLQLVHSHRLQVALGQAERSDRLSNLYLYAANVRLAGQALRQGDAREFRTLLDRCRPDTSRPHLGDPRGFEWFFLRAQDEPVIYEGEHVIQAHQSGAACVRYSPDGTLLASSGFDGFIRFWDATTTRLVRELAGHKGDVNMLAFAPDGQILASAGDDGTVRIWDVTTGRSRFVLRDRALDRVFEVAFSPDGRLLAAGGDGLGVPVWEASTGRLLFHLPFGAIRALAFSRPRRVLGIVDGQAHLRFWSFEALASSEATGMGSEPYDAGPMLGPVNDMVFGPHGPGLISAGDDRTVRILNLELGSFVAVMDGHLDSVSTVAITSDSRTIASGSRDRTVRLWDRHDGQLLVLRGHTDRVNSVTFSPGEAQLASASSDRTVRIWNWRRRVDGARAPVPLLTTSEPSDTLTVALSPDGRRLALNTTSTSFAVHDIPSGKELGRYVAEPSSTLHCLAFAPDHQRIAAGQKDGSIVLWDPNQGKPICRFQVGAEAITQIAFCPDSQLLAACGGQRGATLWDCRSARRERLFEQEGSRAMHLAFAPDGRTIAVNHYHGGTILYEQATGRPAVVLHDHRQGAYDMSFSPDGRSLVTADDDRALRIWNAADGTPRLTLQGHVGRTIRVRFSPDAKTLVGFSDDGLITFWQVETGQEILTWDEYRPKPILFAAFNSDSRALIVGIRRTHDRHGEVWMLQTRSDASDVSFPLR